MSTPILVVDHAVKYFDVRAAGLRRARRWVHAVDDVSLTLAPGRTLGVVGESGCGKSTLGRLIAGLLTPSSGRVLVGEDLRPSGRARRAGRRRTASPVQMVFQDPGASLDPRRTTAQSLLEPMRHRAPESRTESVSGLLELVKLPASYQHSYPHELSGGQQQRVCIARSLAAGSPLVVHDESLSALDATLQARMMNLLLDLQELRGTAYVFISHDLRTIRSLSDEVAVMYLGQIIERAPVDEVQARNLLHPYTVILHAAEPKPTSPGRTRGRELVAIGETPSAVNPPQGCRFAPRCPIARQICSQIAPTLAEQGTGHWVACHYPGEMELSRDNTARPTGDRLPQLSVPTGEGTIKEPQ